MVTAGPGETLPRVLQFGTGVFLRGYFDWMLQRARDAEVWDGSVIGVKLTARGGLPLADQPSFAHTLRGIEGGRRVEEHSKVFVVENWIHPYESWQVVLGTARFRTLDVVVSNSTEAGLAYREAQPPGTCPDTFPAKLAAWLHMRFEAHPTGTVDVLPFELVDDNGPLLREAVLRHADDWALGMGFAVWVRERVRFRSTLVDRIVTKPGPDDDPLAVIAEPYHLLAIEGDDALEERLPLKRAGLNVVYTDDLARYRTRKVRILNGSHHTLLFLGLMSGHGNVLECMEDEGLFGFLDHVMRREVVPALDGDPADLEAYVDATFERFRNPWLDHRLASIALNSAAKVQVRLIPSIADHLDRVGSLPPGLVLAVAAYCAYDHPPEADGCEVEPVRAACAAVPGLGEAVDAAARRLREVGPGPAMKEIVT